MSVNDDYINMRINLDDLIRFIKREDLYPQDTQSAIDSMIKNNINSCNEVINQARYMLQDCKKKYEALKRD